MNQRGQPDPTLYEHNVNLRVNRLSGARAGLYSVASRWLRVLAALVAFGAGIATASAQTPGPSSAEDGRVSAILQRASLIDTFNGAAARIQSTHGARLTEIRFSEDLSLARPSLVTDLPSLRAGAVDVVVMAGPRTQPTAAGDPFQHAIEHLDVVARLAAQYPEALYLARSASEMESAKSRERTAVVAAIRGRRVSNGSLANLRALAGLGARMISLPSDDSADRGPQTTLGPYSQAAITELNRLGVLIDGAGLEPAQFLETIAASKAPLVAAAVGAEELCPADGNLSRQVAEALGGSDGLILVTWAPHLISRAVHEHGVAELQAYAKLVQAEGGKLDAIRNGLRRWREKNPRPAMTIEDVANHVDYFRALVGATHVALGPAFDLRPEGPLGAVLPDEALTSGPTVRSPFGPRALRELLVELARRGYTDEEIRGIAGANWLRTLRKAELTAERLSVHRAAGENPGEPR